MCSTSSSITTRTTNTTSKSSTSTNPKHGLLKVYQTIITSTSGISSKNKYFPNEVSDMGATFSRQCAPTHSARELCHSVVCLIKN
jgi:hypothetical protein